MFFQIRSEVFKLRIHHSSLLRRPSNLYRFRWVRSLKVAHHQFMICSVQGFFEVSTSTLLAQFFSLSMIFAFASILQLLLQWLLPRPITLKSKKPFSDKPVKILVLGDSHMKTVDSLKLEYGLGGHVVHGVAPARRLSTSHGHPQCRTGQTLVFLKQASRRLFFAPFQHNRSTRHLTSGSCSPATNRWRVWLPHYFRIL